MKVLLVTHKYPPHAIGGVEIYTERLALALRERHTVAVYFRHDEPDDPALTERTSDDSGLLLVQVSHRPSGLRATVPGEFFDTFLNRRIEESFRRFLTRFQPDVIHFQHVMGLSARLLRIAKATGKPLVLTLHDYWFICCNSQLVWPDAQTCRGKAAGLNCVRCAAAARFDSRFVPYLRPGAAPLFLYRDWLVRRAAWQADQFLSPSRFLVDQYVSAGFPARRFEVLENGIDVEQVRGFGWHPTEGSLRVTFLGSLAWQKGVHVLAEAFRSLPPGVARLRVWGDTTVFPQYAARLRALLAGHDGQLMGPIANERVGEVMSDTDVLVVPSLWYENSPVVIQEARAAGVPVVASGHGALAEKVRDGTDGLLFPPGDSVALGQVLERLARNRGTLQSLRHSIRPAVDVAEHVWQLDDIYHRVQERAIHSS